MYRIISVAGAMLLAGCTSQPSTEAQATGNTAALDAGDSAAPAPQADAAGNGAAPEPVPPAQANQQLASTADAPASVPRQCYLKVDGVVHLDGTCLVFPMGKHAYTMNTWTRGKPANSHFAMVSPNPDGTGTATWNADPDDDRALDPLGTVRKDGGCWANDRARLCVR